MKTEQTASLSLSVDIIIFALRGQRLQVFLVQRAAAPDQGQWDIPGGSVEYNESLDQAASRALSRVTGVDQVYLEQLYTYGDPQRDPRGRIVTVVYFALTPADAPVREDGESETEQATWFPVDHLPTLAFNHNEILSYALRRLRYKLEYTAVGFQLLPEYFTLSEIQRTYEIILNEKLDKRNFRRRILAAHIIEPTNYKRAGEGRPAQLYRFRLDAVAEVKARRLFP